MKKNNTLKVVLITLLTFLVLSLGIKIHFIPNPKGACMHTPNPKP